MSAEGRDPREDEEMVDYLIAHGAGKGGRR